MAFFKYNRDTIINEINRLVMNVVVKHDKYARENETFEYKRDADNYMSALFEKDTIYSYTDIDDRVFTLAGIPSPPSKNLKVLKDEYGYSEDKIELIMKLQRNLVINDYVEKNN